MTVLQDLAITVEICGGSMISEAAAQAFVVELQAFPQPAVHEALARCRREITGRLSLAHVIERIDDGRPGAEEAWAMVPKDELSSAVVSAEMAEALGVALPLIASGDHVQARMAFTEAYRLRVSVARANRRPVAWRMTLGHDPIGREAARLDFEKRIGIEHQEQSRIEGPRGEEISHLEPLRQKVRELAERKSMERTQEINDALVAADKAHAAGKQCATGCERCMPIPGVQEVERIRIVKEAS